MEGLFRWVADFFRLFKFWTVVSPWERAVRVRAGKHTAILDPGWHWVIPVMDVVWIVNQRLRFTSWPAQTLTTADGKSITLAGNVAFRIIDPLAAMQAFQQPEQSIASIVQTTVSEYVRSRDLTELDADELETECIDYLKRVAEGFTFEFVRVTDFSTMRVLRIIKSDESWRPETGSDKEPESGGGAFGFYAG